MSDHPATPAASQASSPDGTSRSRVPLETRLERAEKRLRLIETQAKLDAYRQVRQAKKAAAQRANVMEQYENQTWLNNYADSMTDRANGPDADFVYPLSTANDRRYGDYWPFWRTWVEHSRLRAASNLIYGLSPLVRGAVQGVGAYVIGEGMQSRAAAKDDNCPKPLLEAVQEWLDEWEKDNDWLSLQQECFVRHQRDGEYFPRLFPQEDGWTLVRLVEPSQIVEPAMPREVGSYGILTDPEDVWDIRGFWVALDGNPANGEQVSSRLMRIHKANVDRGVKRGMPTLSYDMLDYYKLVGRLLENTGTGAAIQAAIAFIRQHDIAPGSAVSEFIGSTGDYTQGRIFNPQRENVRRFEAGTVVDMDAGQKFVETHFAANVQQYVSVVQALLRAIAVAWNAPEWITSADASSNNYASSLTAESPFVKRCKQRQAEFRAVFQWVVDNALRHYCRVKRGIRAAGRVWLWEEVQHFVNIQVTPPTVETRNRQEEASLNQTYIQLGIKSRQTAAQELGLDYEQEERNNEDYEKKHGEQGVPGEMRAGTGGGGPDDPAAGGGDAGGLAAMLGSMGGGAGGEEGEQQTPEAEGADQGGRAAAGAGDPFADAGLDDLFGGLGLPETAEDAAAADAGSGGEGEEQSDADEANHLRATVGGLNALRELQVSVYSGELPRDAAIQNARLMLGFRQEEAEALFPETMPKDMTGGDGGKDEGGDASPDGIGAGGEGEEGGTPADDIFRVVESVMEGFTGRKEDKRGHVRCYNDGKQVKCSSGQHSAGSQDAPKDEATSHIERIIRDPKNASTEDITRCAGSLFRLTADEIRQVKKAYGLRAGGRNKAALIERVKSEARKVVRERQHWARKARAANVEPKVLFQTAKEMHALAGEYQGHVRKMLEDARKLYQRTTGKALRGNHKAFRGGDYTDLEQFEYVARTMADRYPELIGAHGYDRGDNDSTKAAEKLYDFLYAGTPKRPARSKAYEEALEYLQKQRDLFRDDGAGDAEVPF